MTKLHKAFTLIEMIIVIVLIGIMLSITLNISSNQAKELRFRIARENFLTNYNSFIIRAITTNNSSLQLIFASTGELIQVSWSNSNIISFQPTPVIKISSFNNNQYFVNQILSFNTTLGKCQLEWMPLTAESTVNFTLQYIPKPDIERCYEINLSTCKVRPCP